MSIEHVDVFANHLERQVRYTETRLRDHVVQLQRDLADTLQRLDANVHLNSLGVVQSSGREIDRLVAEREQYYETIRVYKSFKEIAQ